MLCNRFEFYSWVPLNSRRDRDVICWGRNVRNVAHISRQCNPFPSFSYFKISSRSLDQREWMKESAKERADSNYNFSRLVSCEFAQKDADILYLKTMKTSLKFLENILGSFYLWCGIIRKFWHRNQVIEFLIELELNMLLTVLSVHFLMGQLKSKEILQWNMQLKDWASK